MSRTLEASVWHHHYGSHGQLKAHVLALLNGLLAKRLETLRTLTPYERSCKV